MLAEGSACGGEGEGGDGGVLVGEVKVEPVCGGGENGVGVGLDLLPLSDVRIVFLILYPETDQSGTVSSYCEGSDR